MSAAPPFSRLFAGRSQANYEVAQSTADRWKNLLPTNYVSKQDVDLKIAEANAKKAMVASAKANVDRLRELEGYKSVVAPFDGVITARNIDVGTLISAGNGSSPELFHIADLRRLRVVVNVPQQQALRPIASRSQLYPSFLTSSSKNRKATGRL